MKRTEELNTGALSVEGIELVNAIASPDTRRSGVSETAAGVVAEYHPILRPSLDESVRGMVASSIVSRKLREGDVWKGLRLVSRLMSFSEWAGSPRLIIHALG